MRHGKKVNHLGRTKSHRDALLMNLAISLVKSKRIVTTLAKAKSLRTYVEPLVTKSKLDTTHNRRIVFSYLQDKEAVTELFGTVSEKVAERNGGYTRIIKLGTRLGDNAQTALIEFVDFNENLLVDTEDSAAKKSRRRRGGKKSASNVEEISAVTEEATVAPEESVEEVVEPTAIEESSEENSDKKEDNKE